MVTGPSRSSSSNKRQRSTNDTIAYPSVTYKDQLGTLSLLKAGLLFQADSNNSTASDGAPSGSLKLKWKDINKITVNNATSPKSILRLSHVNGKTSYMFKFINRELLETVGADMREKWKQQPELFHAKTASPTSTSTMNQSLLDLGEESMTESGFMNNSSSLLVGAVNNTGDSMNTDKDNRRRATMKKSPEAAPQESSKRRSTTSKQGKGKQRDSKMEDEERRKSLPVASAEIAAAGLTDNNFLLVEATPTDHEARKKAKENPGQDQQKDDVSPTKVLSPPHPLRGKAPAVELATINTLDYTTNESKHTAPSKHAWGDLNNRQKKMMLARALGCCLVLVIAMVLAVVVTSQSSDGSSSVSAESSALLRGSAAPITPVATTSTSPVALTQTPQPPPFPTAQPSLYPTPQPSLRPTPAPSVYCRGLPERIDIDNNARKTFDCDLGVPPVRLLWRTAALDSRGFSDDEYFISALQDVSGNFVQIYRTPDQVEGMVAADAISGAIGSGETASRFRVEFECNIENPFLSCEGGTFEFAFVSCGCLAGQIMLEPCSATSLESARDAICVT